MNFRTLSISILVLLEYSASAQWTPQSSPTQSSIHTIRFISNEVGYIGSGYGVHRTIDGGNSWDSPTQFISEYEGEVISSAFINDFYFVNDREGFMVGGGFFNTHDIIARTQDGGETWSLVYNNPVDGNFIRESMNSITFVNETVGFAVGGKGRVVKTMDAGVTWADINLSTTQDLSIVYFYNDHVGFIAGSNVLFKSTDGGNTWFPINQDLYKINDLHFYNTNHGIATTSEGALLKTTDGGGTWVHDPLLNFNHTLTKIDFTGNVGYVLANDASYQTFILKTSDNGVTWEKQHFPDSYGMYALCLAPNGTVWAGGYIGKLYKTTNGGGETSPIAAFTVSDVKFCENQTYIFQNHGYNHYNYEWYVDGVLKSTSYNFVTSFTEGPHLVELKAFNATKEGVVGLSLQIEADVSFKQPLDITFTDGICSENSTKIIIREHEWGTYEVYLNGEILEDKTQNYPYHYFSTPTLSNTTSFTVKATRSNSCEVYEVTRDVIVTVHPSPPIGSVLFVPQQDLCNEGETSIQISNSKDNVQYDLYRTKSDWSPITSTVGNGGIALLNTPLLKDTTHFLVKGSVINGACTDWFEDTVTVNVEKVSANFQMSLLNAPTGQAVSVYNNSFGAANFSWDFSSASEPETSTLTNPGEVVFSITGTHDVSLSVNSATGCSDSAREAITIYDPSNMNTSCWTTEIVYKKIRSSHAPKEYINLETAPNGDVIVMGPSFAPVDFKSETLGSYTVSENSNHNFLARYSQEGILKWVIPNTNLGSLRGALTVSFDGSIYVFGSSYEGVFHSANGTTIRKPDPDMITGQNFILKYSHEGNLVWVKSFEELGIPSEWHYVYAIKTDTLGNLFIANNKVSKISAAGEHLWTTDQLLTTDEYDLGQFTVAGDGSWYFLKRVSPLQLSRYSNDGVLEWKHNIGFSEFGDVPAQTQISADVEGNLVFMYTNVWKSALQLPDPDTNTDPSSLWIVKFAMDGSIIWVNKALDLVYCNDIEVSRNGSINLLLNLYGWQLPDLKTTLQSQDGVDLHLDFTGNPQILVTYNQNGEGLRSRPIRDPAGNGIALLSHVDLAAYQNSVYAVGLVNDESIINGDIIYDLDDEHEVFYLAKFDLDCNNIAKKFDISISGQDQYCIGSIIQVNYLINDQPNENRKFNVYLSDEIGYTSRKRSTLIGTLESNMNSGTIEAIVPDNVVWGVPYFIRVVVDSDPEFYSTLVPINAMLSGDFTPDFDIVLDDLSITLMPTGRQGIEYQFVINEQDTLWGDPASSGMVEYRVPVAGHYSICLIIADECGQMRTICKDIGVYCKLFPYHLDYTIDQKTVSFKAQIDTLRNNTILWNFSDGTTSSEQNPVHTFPNFREYGVYMTITNECGGTHLFQSVVIPCPEINPSIGFQLDRKKALFSNTGNAERTDLSTYLWNFGDGNSSTEKNPQHIYSDEGVYNVSLTETNECQSKTIWVTVIISCPKPNLYFTSATENLNAFFTTHSQYISTIHWDFGDGTAIETVDTEIEHTYLASGTYLVCLSASNECGSEQICKSVEISCPFPEANFDYEITSGSSITFTNQSVNYNTFIWSFGNGVQSKEESPVQQFEPGIYEVCLEVENNCGTQITCQDIVVVVTGRESGLNESVFIYPNPVMDNLLILSEQINVERIEVMTVLGTKVYSESFNSPISEVNINTKSWGSGQYIIIITVHRGKHIRKIVKE